ncbi:replication initiator protein [Flyfo microvirus Tbat2_95]|nr:replication initiator protein [Flyfo microvirus Tbat2_95]
MCVQPAILPDGTEIGCRKCWQCKERYVTDWVGRCIAESKTSVSASVVTLTYGGGDHERATMLTYSDVQKFFKVLRKRGYPCKYLACGEVGQRGRAHWHIVIYWKRKPFPHINRYGTPIGDPKNVVELKGRDEWDKRSNAVKKAFDARDPYRYWATLWPHGHMVWDNPDHRSIRYICKYLRKSQDDHQSYFTMSKVPLIGAEYFERRAKMFVEQSLVPQDLSYGFPEVKDRSGRPIKFMLRDTCAKLFLKAFVREWSKANPGKHMPSSQLVEDFLDKEAARSNEFDRIRLQVIRAYLDSRARRPEKRKAEYSKAHDAFYFGPNKSTFWTGEPYYGEEIEQEERAAIAPGVLDASYLDEEEEFLRSEGIFR